MANAVAPESQDEERNNGVIGIGTDGNPVDMDLWEYNFDETTNGYGLNDLSSLTTTASANASKGFYGTTFENIIIPQYISVDFGNTYIPVTNLDWTFFNCTELEKISKIPSTIISMRYTFRGCTSLTIVSSIPESVINMSSSFHGCTSLISIGPIGNNVKIMKYTFYNCNNLEKIINIPSETEDLSYTFYQCYKIKSVPNIPDKIKYMDTTFYNCINLKTVPTIPESVIIMYQTFRGCSNLTGNLEINAILKGELVNDRLDYLHCFENASTNDDANLTLTGNQETLTYLMQTKSINSHISLKN